MIEARLILRGKPPHTQSSPADSRRLHTHDACGPEALARLWPLTPRDPEGRIVLVERWRLGR